MIRREPLYNKDIGLVGSGYQNLRDESDYSFPTDDLSLYASVPPWEYIIHYTSVASNQTMYNQEDFNIEKKATMQLKLLLTSIENLLNELRSQIFLLVVLLRIKTKLQMK